MSECISHFRQAIADAGLTPPDAIEPGRFHRFPGLNKQHSNRAGWCVLFDDGQAGCFGDWSTGFSKCWHGKSWRQQSRHQLRQFAHAMAKARQQAKAQRVLGEADAAMRAKGIWHRADPAPSDYPYLVRKGILPWSARLYKSVLVLPVINFNQALTSLQFIDASGNKRLLRGGHKKDCFIPVTAVFTEPRVVIVCEGWATGCTLAASEPDALVLAAIDAGNLKAVAMACRDHWPEAALIVAGDDDRLKSGNPGATHARAAAIAANGLLALPEWPENAPEYLSDFNDLALWLAGGGE